MRKKLLGEKVKKGWTLPVLKGDVYCSPFCDGGCKKSEYDYAVKQADLLCKELNSVNGGNNWKPKVWENLGWYYKAKCIINETCWINVCPYSHEGKTVYWIDSFLNGRQYILDCGNNPVKGVSELLKRAENDAKALLRDIESCSFLL